MGPLSRKIRVKQWKSNGTLAASICDHYGVEAWDKKAMEEATRKPFIRCNCRACGRCHLGKR